VSNQAEQHGYTPDIHVKAEPGAVTGRYEGP
jgi:hypothetical protein